jgi:hypothetical protein
MRILIHFIDLWMNRLFRTPGDYEGNDIILMQGGLWNKNLQEHECVVDKQRSAGRET